MMAGSGVDPAAAGESELPVEVVEWEDLQQELARLWSLSSALKKAKEKKEALAQRIESVIQGRRDYLHQSNEIEEMRQKVEDHEIVMDGLLSRSKMTVDCVKNQREQLGSDIRLLLVASKMLSSAHQQLQEANKLLAGERGREHLQNMQQMMRARQQCMLTQVSALYPVKTEVDQSSVEALDANGSKPRSSAGTPNSSKPLQRSSFTILGLQLPSLPPKNKGRFGDKKELQRSSSALGCVARAVLLIAAYLDVLLRYPLQFGGSRSYVHDYAPSFELMTSDVASNSTSVLGLIPKTTEFPLFLEGQDSTRSAYAIFLLNKDIEQLLNFVGAQSLGPRHVLPNLKELMRIIQSKEYVDT